MRIVLDASLDLLHQREHLLGRETRHSLADRLWSSPRLTGGTEWTEKYSVKELILTEKGILTSL